MASYWLVLGLAALPALANLAGGILAELVQVSDRVLSLVLHLAAGIVLAVVGLELMPAALDGNAPWIPLVAFVAGGAAFVGLDKAAKRLQGGRDRADGEESTSRARALGIFSGVSLDLFSDGVMIGTGALVNPGLGLVLALGQVPADLPEGFAAIATMRRAGVPRLRRVLLAASFTIPTVLGATLGYFALRDAPEIATLSVLALTGGVLLSVVVEEMISEAHDGETSALGAVLLTAGFSLFAAVSIYVGGGAVGST